MLSFFTLIVNFRIRTRGGWLVHSLYYFDSNFFENKIAQAYSGSISSISIHEKIMLWHFKVGYLSFPYLKYLFPKLFKNSDCYSLHCESCYLSKSNKVTYLTNHIILPNYFIWFIVMCGLPLGSLQELEKKWFHFFHKWSHTTLLSVFN